MTPTAHTDPTRLEIEHWLTLQIALHTQREPEQIRSNLSFEDLGLDSALMVLVSCDLEVWLRRTLSPHLLFEHPTIAALSECLAKPTHQEIATGRPVRNAISHSEAEA